MDLSPAMRFPITMSLTLPDPSTFPLICQRPVTTRCLVLHDFLLVVHLCLTLATTPSFELPQFVFRVGVL